jgi:integrase
VAETLTEVKGKLIAGPPKTRAGRRIVGLPPSSSVSWRHILSPRSGPVATSSPPPVGAAAGPGFRARSWVPATEAAGLQGLRIHDLRHTAVALWIAAGATPKEVAVRGAHLGQLHPGPLWPPDDPLAGRGGPVPSSKD